MADNVAGFLSYMYIYVDFLCFFCWEGGWEGGGEGRAEWGGGEGGGKTSPGEDTR